MSNITNITKKKSTNPSQTSRTSESSKACVPSDQETIVQKFDEINPATIIADEDGADPKQGEDTFNKSAWVDDNIGENESHLDQRMQIKQQESSAEAFQREIELLAKNFGHNERMARKYWWDRKKIKAFLELLRRTAREKAGPLQSGVISFEMSVEELAQQSGTSCHEVDKWLRWSDRSLKILKCVVPKNRKDRQRVVTMDLRTVGDLEFLMDPSKRVGFYDKLVEVAINGFKFKSLCAFALNIAVGCLFGCLFCYVPSVSTINLGWRLIQYGILDADAEWGTYCLIRLWDEEHFRNSLRQALTIPESELPADGHRAIMMSTDTDPYMPVFHPEPRIRRELHQHLRTMVRRILEILLEPEFSGLKLRLQTRGLEVERDFDLLEKFGDRLLLGMSIPTLDNRLAKVYEPKAPAPTKRLEVLQKAKTQGINIYVAMAPTYPECDEKDLRNTLLAFAELKPWTIFHAPINTRCDNVTRI